MVLIILFRNVIHPGRNQNKLLTPGLEKVIPVPSGVDNTYHTPQPRRWLKNCFNPTRIVTMFCIY